MKNSQVLEYMQQKMENEFFKIQAKNRNSDKAIELAAQINALRIAIVALRTKE